MATKEDDFKQRFVAIVQDLRSNGSTDPEAMFLIGSLAARLLDRSAQPTWSVYKQTMTRAHYDKLLADFEKQGNDFHKDGKTKQAYAIQVLAASVIARTQDDADVRAGDQLLDDILGFLVTAYRKAKAADPKPH